MVSKGVLQGTSGLWLWYGKSSGFNPNGSNCLFSAGNMSWHFWLRLMLRFSIRARVRVRIRFGKDG